MFSAINAKGTTNATMAIFRSLSSSTWPRFTGRDYLKISFRHASVYTHATVVSGADGEGQPLRQTDAEEN